MKLIDKGAHGSVWLLENGRSVAKSNQIFVNKDALYISDGGVVEAVAFERALSCGVRHIVNDYTRFVESGIIWSRMEYLEKIEVVDRHNVKKYIKQLFEALSDLHSMGIAHRDVKLENIMYRRSRDELVLIDFSMAKLDHVVKPHESVSYTSDYRAPEVLLRMPCYDYFATDVWAAGVCAASMLINRKLIDVPDKWQKTLSAILETLGVTLPSQSEWPGITSLKRWKKFTAHHDTKWTPSDVVLKEPFILEILTISPKNRPTAKNVLRHPFLSEISDTPPTAPRQQSKSHERIIVPPKTVRLVIEAQNSLDLCTETILKGLDVLETFVDCSPAAALCISAAMCEACSYPVYDFAIVMNEHMSVVQKDIISALARSSVVSVLATPSILCTAYTITNSQPTIAMERALLACYLKHRPTPTEIVECAKLSLF